MKYTAILALFIFIIFGWVWYQKQLPCREPLAYDIGKIDSRQNFGAEEFLALVKRGEAIWEKGSGKDLFVYKKGARIKVNLVYDDRQKTYNERKKESATLGLTEEVLKEEKDKLSLLQSVYESKLSAYNSTVANWNARGGAPPGVIATLQSQKNELESDARQLEATVSRYNDLAKGYNSRVADWNTLAHEETTAGEARSTGEINIYLIEYSSSDNILVAHELGHALGLGHVDNEKSIMYYRLPQGLLAPSQSDLVALDNLCSK
jgi:hypothetical protein